MIKFDSGAAILEDEFDHHPSPQADKHLFAVSMCVTTTNRLGWHTANKKRALWHKWEKTEIELPKRPRESEDCRKFERANHVNKTVKPAWVH